MTIPWPIALDIWDVWRFLIKAQITFNQEVSPGETHMTTSTWHIVIACSLPAHCQFKGVNQQCSTWKGFIQTFTKRKQMEKNEFELKYTLWQHYWHSSLILSVSQISDEIDGLPYYHLLYVDIKMFNSMHILPLHEFGLWLGYWVLCWKAVSIITHLIVMFGSSLDMSHLFVWNWHETVLKLSQSL